MYAMTMRTTFFPPIILAAAACVLCGCGTTKQTEATRQLISSDAVDRSIARIDFRPLAGQTVFFDTQYITNYKGIGFVNAEYVISSLRQQMFAAGCLLQESKDEAEYVVEARIGSLGSDEHEVVYGIPANNALSAAADVVPNAPQLPTIPEISVARKENQRAAAKIAAFAYHRESHEPVWQSGLSVATSSAKDTWFLGAGPFESGSYYDGVEFAGSRLRIPFLKRKPQPHTGPIAAYSQEMIYQRPKRPEPDPANVAEDDAEAGDVQQASAEESAAE